MNERPFTLLMAVFVAILALALLVTVAYVGLALPVRGVVVPRVTGLPFAQAEQLLGARGLGIERGGDAAPDTLAAGLVARQEPSAGLIAMRATRVRVLVSPGPRRSILPALAGLVVDQARTRLAALGLAVGTIDTVDDPRAARGTIVNTMPAPGTAVTPGTPVALAVARGRTGIIVPDLTGRRLAAARRLLADLGLGVGPVRYELSAEYPTGMVIGQDPSAGTVLAAARTVALRVATARP